MTQPIHYIISRSRYGWSVNIESDRVQDYRRHDDAREAARDMSRRSEEDGHEVSLIDLGPADEV